MTTTDDTAFRTGMDLLGRSPGHQMLITTLERKWDDAIRTVGAGYQVVAVCQGCQTAFERKDLNQTVLHVQGCGGQVALKVEPTC